jgi:aryl-alcohol dehydrogenase-like predicted oxidoreductase
MKLRPLGQTGLLVSELALGTWGLSGDGYGPVGDAEQDAVIQRARAFGITLFDTAPSYARGDMERRLGRLLAGDSGAQIVTKLGTDRDAVPARKRFDAAYLRRSLDESRERLSRETVDVVLLHNPSARALADAEATATLAEFVTQGSARAWGVAAGSAETARLAIERGAQVIALPYNLFHQTDLRAAAELAKARGVGVLAHSVLGYGLLAGLWSPNKDFAPEDHRLERWTRDDLRRRVRQLDAVRPLVGGEITSLRAAALRFVLANELVSSALVGPRSGLQLDQLVRESRAGTEYLPSERLTALTARLREVGIEA